WVPAAPPVTATPAAPPAPPPQQNVVDVAHQGGTIIVSVQNGAGQPVAALVTLLGEGRKFTTGPDGIGSEKVPAGTIELSAWAEGYRPTRATVVVEKGQKAQVSLTLEPSRVVVLADRVDIRDKIFFEFDSAVITADSFRILDDLAATLDNHVEIELLEVQGHTDDQGAEDYNQKLSQSRAEAVRDYLVKSGIAGDRLVARGYGESQPLQPGTSEEAREVNRRVAFKILKGTRYPEAPPAEREQKGPRKRL
ncbi:MAG: OmpA family protein, partial [Deltaproteobacteria bacterium]|nr:OmpA family protein [Deltaproteobacteria bacterium]